MKESITSQLREKGDHTWSTLLSFGKEHYRMATGEAPGDLETSRNAEKEKNTIALLLLSVTGDGVKTLRLPRCGELQSKADPISWVRWTVATTAAPWFLWLLFFKQLFFAVALVNFTDSMAFTN